MVAADAAGRGAGACELARACVTSPYGLIGVRFINGCLEMEGTAWLGEAVREEGMALRGEGIGELLRLPFCDKLRAGHFALLGELIREGLNVVADSKRRETLSRESYTYKYTLRSPVPVRALTVDGFHWSKIDR